MQLPDYYRKPDDETKIVLRSVILTIYGVYAVTVFALGALATVVAVALLPQLTQRRRAARALARLIFLFAGVPLKVQRVAPLPDTPCVVVANHASYIDGVVLCAVLPPQFGFVIKREVTQAPVVHFLLRRIGAHFVERHDRQRGATDARQLLRAANEGRSLAVFPEGTFRLEPGLRRFHPGAFAAAVSGGLPVIPLAIEGSRAILPAGRWLPRPGRLDLTTYAPIPCTGEGRQEMVRLARAARAVLLRGVSEPDLTLTPSQRMSVETATGAVMTETPSEPTA